MFLRGLVLLGLVALTGCASVSHQPLTEEVSAGLRGKSIVQSRSVKPDFSAFTAGKAAFAVLGAAAMISEGNQIVKDNNIDDPAVAISEGLIAKLQASRGMQVVSNTKVAEKDDVSELVKVYPGADYILDVKTINWMFNYYPSDWSHYKVTYGSRMRLIDAKRGTVVAETACSGVQGDDKNPPTKDDLLKDNAALLKSYLSKAAASCIDLLSKDILKL